MLRLLLLSSLLSIASCCLAQSKDFYALKKGNIIPDLSFSVAKGNTQFNIKLSDYKGKIILLDFWGTHCLDCIAGMPHILQLQQRFKDSVQVIMVTENTLGEINQLFATFETKPSSSAWVAAGRSLPFITEDSVLTRLFPHKGLPAHIWINKDQSFLARTYVTSTTIENVEKLIKGQPVRLDEQGYGNIELDDPLSWLGDTTMAAKVPAYSFFTNHIEFGMGGFNPSKLLSDPVTKKNIGISCINKSIPDLYKQAYKTRFPGMPVIPDTRLIIQTKNLRKFFAPDFNLQYYQWADSNLFCYGLKTHPTDKSNIYSGMIADLDMFFNVKSFVSSRKIKCWVLKRLPGTDKIRSKKTDTKYERKNNKLVMQNLEMENLFNELSDLIDIHYPQSIFIDRTNYHAKIDVELPWSEKKESISLSKIRNALQHYGLDIVNETTDLDMLILIDQN